MPTADLTVLIPNHNHARYLPRSLGAVFSQSVQPREVVVIDDASTDDSLAVLESFAQRHPTMRIVRNERNLGVVGTLNRGVGLTQGRHLLAGGADDYVLPGFFEKAMTLLDRHPSAGLCFANDAFQIGNDGAIQPNAGVWPERPDFYDADGVCRHMRNTIPGHATIFRTAVLREAGGYDADLAWYSDWFVNLTVAFRHGACHIPEPLAIRVLLDENYSAAAKPGARHIAVLKAFFHRVSTPEHADVAPYFRRCGAAVAFGTDLIRAAAARPDLWQPHILGFLNGFNRWDYRGLLDDPDPVVREVAAFFLGPFWQREEEEFRVAIEKPLRNELEHVKRHLPPPGLARKMSWLAGLALRKVRYSVAKR